MSCGRGCECSVCHRHFGGLTGFDAHKVVTTGEPGYDPEYDWRCGTDEELASRGLRVDGRGFWIQETRFRSWPSAPGCVSGQDARPDKDAD